MLLAWTPIPNVNTFNTNIAAQFNNCAIKPVHWAALALFWRILMIMSCTFVSLSIKKWQTRLDFLLFHFNVPHICPKGGNERGLWCIWLINSASLIFYHRFSLPKSLFALVYDVFLNLNLRIPKYSRPFVQFCILLSLHCRPFNEFNFIKLYLPASFVIEMSYLMSIETFSYHKIQYFRCCCVHVWIKGRRWKKTNKWTVKSDSIGNWRKLINMERIQTEKEWKGANELSGWSQDNRNYNSSPPKRDSDDYSEKKKHVIIILSSGSTKFGTLLFGYWTNGNWKSISRLFVSLFNLCARLVSFSTCIKAYSSDAIIKINRLFVYI